MIGTTEKMCLMCKIHHVLCCILCVVFGLSVRLSSKLQMTPAQMSPFGEAFPALF